MLLMLFLFTTILTPQGMGVIELNTTGEVSVSGPFQFEVVAGNNTTLIRIYPIPNMVYRQEEGIVITVREGNKVVRYPAVVRVAYSSIPGKVDVGNISVSEEPIVVEQEYRGEGWGDWLRVLAGIALGIGLIYLISQKLSPQ